MRSHTLILALLVVITPQFIVSAPAMSLSDLSNQIPRQPILPDNFKVGDLMFIESVSYFQNVCNSWDHVAMYIGDNMFIESNDYSKIPRPIGGTSGVQVTPLWKYKLWTQCCAFGTVVSANESQRQAAVDWALAQRGEGNFQTGWAENDWWANPNPNDESDPNSDKWYCAELIWAAYYNSSGGAIDIDFSPGPLPPPSGDGIHFAVNPQDIAINDNVSIYTDANAPSPPEQPDGYPQKATYPQIGVYTTVSPDNADNDLYYQWMFGDSFRPDLSWDYVPAGSESTTKMHLWKRMSVHDRIKQNYVFDIRVRCKDPYGRVSAWSDPLSIHVTPGYFQTDWVLPTGFIDTDWIDEEKAIDGNSLITGAVCVSFNESGWCTGPLVLTMDNPVVMKGFRIRASRSRFHDEMKVICYNGSDYVANFTFQRWPHFRFVVADYCRNRFIMDRVEIWIHKSDPLIPRVFSRDPVWVYDFSLWTVDDAIV